MTDDTSATTPCNPIFDAHSLPGEMPEESVKRILGKKDAFYNLMADMARGAYREGWCDAWAAIRAERDAILRLDPRSERREDKPMREDKPCNTPARAYWGNSDEP